MAIKRLGKVGLEWQRTRRLWFKDHAPDWRDTYPCGLCGQPVHKSEVDLDHIVPKGSHPELRAEQSNLRPVHRSCHIKRI